MRSSKTINEVTTTFSYNGSLLMAQVQGSGASQVKQLYSYDANGQLISVNYNGTEYYYLRNGQTDIVGLMDGSGNRVVEYTYDAWGKLISTTGTLATSLGADNPFRYRGYYYDTETGLYYLMTRYYDPEVCRFISADVYLSTGQGVLGNNRFAYCNNNPMLLSDSNGTSPGTPVLTIVDYYAIHKLVQTYIIEELGGAAAMEVYVKAENGRKGFLDVYDPVDSSYYEVKSEKASSKLSTERQMQRYDNSKVVAAGHEVSRGTKVVSGSFSYGFWDIEYSSKKDGLVTYNANFNWGRAGKSLSGIAVAVGVGFIVYYAGGLIDYRGFSTTPAGYLPPMTTA